MTMTLTKARANCRVVNNEIEAEFKIDKTGLEIIRQYIPTIDELEFAFHITARNNDQYVTLVCRVDKPDKPGGHSAMHLAEIIQNVIDTESIEPNPVPASHESTVFDSSPKPYPRKKRKLIPQARKGTHECPIDIDASEDDDEEDYDNEIAARMKVRDKGDDIKPRLQLEFDSTQNVTAQRVREDPADEGIGAAGVERGRTALRREVSVPVNIIVARSSSDTNQIRNRTPTSLVRQYVDHVTGPGTPLVPTSSMSASSSCSGRSAKPPVAKRCLNQSEIAKTLASITPSSPRLPITQSSNRIAPLSHAMLTSIHGNPRSDSRPTRLQLRMDRATHPGRPLPPTKHPDSPKSTDASLDKGKTVGRNEPQSGLVLVEEETVEYRRDLAESRCRSPVDTSALRQQLPSAFTEDSDSCTTSPPAAPKETTLLASSPTPDSTLLQDYESVDLSGKSADAESRNLQPGGSSSSKTTEQVSLITPANQPLNASSFAPMKPRPTRSPPSNFNPSTKLARPFASKSPIRRTATPPTPPISQPHPTSSVQVQMPASPRPQQAKPIESTSALQTTSTTSTSALPTPLPKDTHITSVPSIDKADLTPPYTATDTSSAPDMVDEHLRTPHSAAVLRRGAMGSRPSAGPIPHSTPAPSDSRPADTNACITRAPSRPNVNPANVDRTHKPNLPMVPPVISTKPLIHPSLPPKPSTLTRNQEYSAVELSQFQTVLDNNGTEHRWLTIKRGFRSHDLRFNVTAETRAGLISQVFKKRGWLEGVYGSQTTNVGIYLDGKPWLSSWTVQQIGLWGMLAPGASRAYLIEVELTYSSVMPA